jgi:ABC-type phosphate/phosphonate transport system substrate-binding protein
MRSITLLLPTNRPGLTQTLRCHLHEIVQLAVPAPVVLASVPAALLPQVLDGSRDAIAWAPPLVAHEILRQRLAAPIAVADAASDYAAMLVGSASVECLADIARQRVGWVSKLSATGYQIPRLYLESFGLDLSSLFASERFYGSHEAVARALAAGEIDVAATHSGRLLDVLRSSRARILTSVGPIPADVIVASPGLAGDVREAIALALLSSTLGPVTFEAPRRLHLDLFDLLRSDANPVLAPRPLESGIAVC